MAMHEHNMVAIGRERKIIIWNIESGSCDQKLSRGKIYHNQNYKGQFTPSGMLQATRENYVCRKFTSHCHP